MFHVMQYLGGPSRVENSASGFQRQISFASIEAEGMLSFNVFFWGGSGGMPPVPPTIINSGSKMSFEITLIYFFSYIYLYMCCRNIRLPWSILRPKKKWQYFFWFTCGGILKIKCDINVTSVLSVFNNLIITVNF